MAKSISLSMLGDSELQRKFDELSKRFQRKLIRGALRKGADMVLTRTQQLAPVKTGALVRTLKIDRIKGSKAIGFQVVTGTREELGIDANDKGYYPAAQEFGSAKMPAHPYMRPAADDMRDAVLSMVASDIKSAVESIPS